MEELGFAEVYNMSGGIIGWNAEGLPMSTDVSDNQMDMAEGHYTFVNVTADHTIDVTFAPNILKGDLNGDGQIRSNDAILTLRIAAGLIIPSDDQEWAADMNDDGVVRSNDAILILRKAAGLAAPGALAIASPSRQIAVALAEVYGIAGGSMTVPLNIDNIHVLGGGDVYISYDSAVLQAVDVSPGSHILLASDFSEPGIVRIAFAVADKPSSRTVARIEFSILTDDVSPLELNRLELYDPNALPLDARAMDKKFSSWAIAPKHSALLQNFPNPFNPETWIPYQLKEGSEVAIRIYSLTGELVREIDLGYKSAGLYISQNRAAHWDGRNTSGEKTASGIYFYSIQARGFASTRKMVIAQ
jgi:hypothetical protein